MVAGKFIVLALYGVLVQLYTFEQNPESFTFGDSQSGGWEFWRSRAFLHVAFIGSSTTLFSFRRTHGPSLRSLY